MKIRTSTRAAAALAGFLSVTLVVTLLGQQPAIAAKPKPYTPPRAAAVPSVPVRKVVAAKSPVSHFVPASARPAPVWPAASSATGPATAGLVAKASPVTVRTTALKAATPPAIRVDVLDQAASSKAAVHGLLFRVGRGDGVAAATPATVSVDYGSFATAYGADWSTRLRLVRMPACALDTPQLKQCAGAPVPTTNDIAAHTASASVRVGGTQLFALAASASGPAGSYGATSLNASGTWSAGSSSGNFSWSYPMRTPPAMGGPSPTLELGYSSQAVDGLMAASNNQPSEVGEGFNLSVGGYIERRYKSCSEDTTDGNNSGTADKDAADECWATDNATLSLNGAGGELIKEPGTSNIWHLRNDDGSKIEHRFDASNGAQKGEWWVVTTVNGTQYWFGRNKLPGWSTGDTTNATWTVPVFGNHTGEPCHQDTFTASSCVQAWRWNLDYVVDPHGNSMSYWYRTDQNNYQSGTGKVQSYVRAGYLDHVSYGTRVEPDPLTGKDTYFTGHPSARVDFDYADRCLSDCGTHDAKHWSDTPWDLACSDDTKCDAPMPAFYSTRRLTAITTSVYDAGLGKNRNVEQWTLTQSFPDPKDGTRAGLWLDKIGHTGLVGGSKALPDVTFTGKAMPNRVDAVDNSPAMNWPRVTDINTETGAIVHVDYLDSDCVAGKSVPTSPQSNTMRCYPVRWTPPGFPEKTDYFNRYVVNEVTETDKTGGSTRILHHYSYLTDPAWHYADDDGLISKDAKTWSVWRGYGKVGVTTGDPGSQTYTETTFFRGMDGDHLPTGTRSVSVKDSQGASVPDEDGYAGMVRETRTLLGGPNGAEVSGEIHDPWESAPTATRTIDKVTVNARFVNTEGSHSRVTLDHAPWVRKTYTKSTFDAYGMVVKEDDFGDQSVTGDEQCTVNTFEPRNTTAWLVSLPQRVQTYALTCDQVKAGPVTEADAIGDARSYYDNHAYGVAPTKGDVTKTEQMDTWNNGNPTYVQVTRTGYDALGRSVDSWDALDHHSGTAYTPATTGPVTQTVDTNPSGWKTTTTVEPAWGLSTSSVDVNLLRTDQQYDPLGRLTAVWGPGRTKGKDTPDVSYDYLIRTNAVNAVTASHLNPKGGVTTSFTLYDGLLRPRQTQTTSPAGGRILTDTFYDAAGRESDEYGAYYDRTGAPGTDLVKPLTPQDVPNQTRTVYDGAGRPVASVFEPKAVERWRTTTSYGGDHTDVSPPQGGTATSTWTDARGHTVQLRQYPTRTPGGDDYDHTDYAYNRKGLLASVTAPDGSRWTYGYDLRGRKISSVDPDAGSSTTRYDKASRVTGSTDGNGNSLTFVYDNLDRKIALYKGISPTSSGQLAQWDYDTAKLPDGVTPVLGPPSQTTRIDGAKRYTVATSQYDLHYRPQATTVTIPSTETGLAGSYAFTTGYNPDGSVSGMGYPRTGDLQPETLLLDYTDFDQPLDMVNVYGNDGESSIVSDSHYDALGHATQYTLYTGLISGKGPRAYLSYETDQTTGRLNEISMHRDGITPNTVTDMHYTYDDAGNVIKMADTPTGGGYNDIQCFTYDRYQRVQDAWTPTADDCAAAPTNGALGGPAPYWQTYAYNAAGGRSQLIDHATANGDVTTEYNYVDAKPDDPTAGQPHALAGTTTTDNTGTHTAAYTYDKGGNTKTRPGPHGTQTLNWDAEGHLSSVTDTAGTVSYLYDADGNRLISRDTSGKTLYLPGEELRYTNSTSAATCTRYYSYAGGTVAQRTAQGLKWLASDHQGTQDVTMDAVTQVATIRRQTPFGTPRGTPVTWSNDKGFIGGTTDPTGLTHLGAREYDPVLGRFISVDPVLNASDPQSLEGYAYADNSPIVHADPSGRIVKADSGGGTYSYTPQGSPDYPQTNSVPSQPDKPKHCGWGCKFKHGFTAATNWVDDHKAAIAGAVIGTAVGLGCGAAIGWTGIGAIACGAAAGAVGNMVQYAVETKVEHKGNFSLGGMLKTGAVGGIVGGVMGGLGSVAGQAIKAGASSLLTSIGSRVAVKAATPAVEKEASGVVSGLAKNAIEKAPAKAASGPAKALEGCLTHSFAPGTAVLMADGSAKLIKNIKVGDKVRATDPVTGKTAVRKVLVVHLNHDTALTDLTVKIHGHTTVIHTTPHHPFWDATRKMWVSAADLDRGDALDTAGATSGAVVRATNFHGVRFMYDLTVDITHTYYVLAGNTPVLVHNCGGGFKAGIGADEVDDINRSFGGQTTLNGSFDNTMINASRYNSFYDKSAVVIRDIAGGHMFDNGNKRTAQAVVEQLMQRNNVVSGPTSAELRGVIDSVGKGKLSSVEDISRALRGY